MKNNKLAIYAVTGVILMWVVLWITQSKNQSLLGEVEGARGKSPSLPLTDILTPEESLAQDLALSEPRVQDLTVGRNSEVFEIKRVGMDFPAGSAACAQADCRQVEIYLWAENATVVAIVNITSREVLDIFYQPDTRPALTFALMERAATLVHNAPEVAKILGYQPALDEIFPMQGDMLDTSCNGTHICASATFPLGKRILWVTVDLTENRVVGTGWTTVQDNPVVTPRAIVDTCPQPGTVNLGGWTVSYETTSSDGFRVYNVSYQGIQVATSIKLLEWHVRYSDTFGFNDFAGCGIGTNKIPPYGETTVVDLLEEGKVVGFDLVQDFRMSNWGGNCNYRYEQHFQFYFDGRFRVVQAAYGRGCGTQAQYRPVVRMDLAINGDPNDNFDYWDGSQWIHLATEDYRVPYVETNHGPHSMTPEGYAWRVYDAGGTGYYIEMDVGQFGDGGEGDAPFIFATLHKPEQGDTDMPTIGTCCMSNHEQGPHAYVGGESIEDQNIVLWYVPQGFTDGKPAEQDGDGYYCYTVTTSETYPCFMGPMFHPILATVNGEVNLQGRTNHGGVTVSASNGSQVYTAQTDASGNYSLELPQGTYTISVEMDKYLDAVQSGVAATVGQTTALPLVTLLGGDVNNNDTINILDLSFIGSHFNLTCSDTGWDTRADINGDCVVDNQDLTLATDNYKKSSPVPWN